MDMRKIKKLIELIQSTGVAEIEIKEGEESVRITREVKVAPMMMAAAAQMSAPAAQAPQAAAETRTETSAKAAETAANADKHTLKAPMVGTVYLSATPGAKAFVEVGQTVKAGDVIMPD